MNKIKNIFLAGALSTSALGFSQVAIGKANISTLSDNVTPNPSISLEFGNGNRGIILPWVENAAAVVTAGVVDGTIIYDRDDKKVKYRRNGTWFDLSVNTEGTMVDPVSGVNGETLQTSATEKASAKAAIGTNGATDSTPGILVLTDTTKAMVLPKVASPHLNIINPAAGMMVYDTTAKQLAVFNGTVWSFWKP